MEEHPVFMVSSHDAFGDQHLFATDDLDRASAAYHAMKERYGNVLVNDGLAEAMNLTEAG